MRKDHSKWNSKWNMSLLLEAQEFELRERNRIMDFLAKELFPNGIEPGTLSKMEEHPVIVPKVDDYFNRIKWNTDLVLDEGFLGIKEEYEKMFKEIEFLKKENAQLKIYNQALQTCLDVEREGTQHEGV